MITGVVNADLEPIIHLVVLGNGTAQQQVEAIVDTGYNGALTLPPAAVAELGLEWLGRDRGILADGSEEYFDVYRATVLWDGKARSIEIESIDAATLLGMTLLKGHELINKSCG